ncbi:MAG: Membrane protein insertase, YidC/Oxa1 family [Candidatus Woesebacteria bacterium GW2011_GWA1_37_8]|uniref:Membrane protein insertase, YidC/Oxa1 family n=2 Tax=Candidatus Woeseibacteriota TaxID=1752722 RepID=A0A0G0L4L3_9BACT|nr:MAG: Membrane protein insertase, YidC/Oxa1 family [Microgenomates group bacterium GW2011_GWC1_37_12b]KKQ43238.1 MAG: Membrane protein insertase, YidC/Oxa1 family [Candidatus Woesebacteria bacterium GW2011_GWA1_37_8]KKQ85967.1 MAG: Membrane protein insertase, YidC/Oxa1 family [Candidatus Woesebacteria bacterium GW2011_GWB1_38_8b]
MFYTILVQPLANGLILFYKIFGNNLGLAIILFTVALRVILNPLTKPYMESMKKMKDLGPELNKLKQRHGSDKIKFAKAQSDFYKEKGINPGAGCLPYLLQIVVLIAFFNVFTRTISGGGNLTENFNKVLYQPLKLESSEVINTKFFYLEMTKPDTFKLPGIQFAIPGPLILLSAIAQFLSAKAQSPVLKKEKKLAEKTKTESDDFQVAMRSSMIYTFPLFTLWIGMKFPSALALYWLVFSLLQLYQQVKGQGWGGLEPLIGKLKMVKSKN